jgi:hypothetical protein
MGEILKGILSGVSGTVGTVVGSNYRGKDILRSKPKKSSKPPVQAQVDQRFKFGLVTAILSNISDLIKLAFKVKNKYLSPMNTAVQYNLEKAIVGVSPNFELQYSLFRIANGKLQGLTMLTFAAAANLRLNLTWDITDNGMWTPEQKLIRDKDTLRLVLYCEETEMFFTTGYTATRSAGTFQTRMPNAEEGNTVHVWLVVVATDLKSTSTSQYLGAVEAIS